MRNNRRTIQILALLFCIPAGFVLYKVMRSVFFIEDGVIRSRVPKIPSDLIIANGNAFSDLTYAFYNKSSKKFLLKSSSVEEKEDSRFEFKDLIFHFRISDKELGVISETGKGWTRELNMVSWNDRDPKYDIRDWSPDHTRMSKGVSFTEEEMEKLVELFNTRNEEDSFEE